MADKPLSTSRAKNTTQISVSLPKVEKEALDKAVAASGVNRNRFLRNLIIAAAQRLPKARP